MRRRRSCVLIAAWCVALTGAGGLRASQDQAPPTFRTDSRLVRVSVVVHDRNGRPVPGLTAGDFQLLENGREQQVSLFLVEESGLRRAADASPTRISNRIDGPASTGVTLILYDRLNTRFEHQHLARTHVIQYLKQLRPDARVGLYVLESDAIRVVHSFTRDTASLLKALERTGVQSSVELTGSEDRVLPPPPAGDAAFDAQIDAWLQETEQKIQGFYLERRVNGTIGALEGLARHLAGVRGRKNVIWISSGFPLRFHDGISVQNAGQDVLRTTRALNDADIAIYPVDARGLVGAFATPANVRQQQFTTLNTVMGPVETSQVIAERTGGRAFFNTNDLGAAIRRAAEDTRLTYVLGYYPASAEWDGTFREIKVHVRRRGVNVRHRKGYFAIAPTAPAAAGRASALFDALSSPLDVSGVGLSAEFTPRGSDEVTVTARIEPDGITMRDSGGYWEGQVVIAIAQVLPDGRLFKSLDMTVPLRLEPSVRERLMAEGLTISRTLTLRADAHQIRIAVMDPPTGAIGTVTIPAASVRPGRAP